MGNSVNIQTPTQVRDQLHALAKYLEPIAAASRKTEKHWAAKAHSPFAEAERREMVTARHEAQRVEAWIVLLRSGMHVEQQLAVFKRSAEVQTEMRASMSCLARTLNEEMLVFLKRESNGRGAK